MTATTHSPIAQGLTLRSLVIGLLLAFGVGAVVPFLGLYVQGSNSGAYFTSQIAHLLLFLLILVVNASLGPIRRSWVLQRGELVVIFIMTSLANSVPGLLSYWVPLASSPFYYASPENNWGELILPYIPTYLVPHDLEAIRAFFEGNEGQSSAIPWEVWLTPLLSWLPLVVALHVATLCLMVVVRRHWVENERLVYPVMQLPLAMVQDDERGSLIKPFFRNGVMWIGFAVPVITGTVIGLHAYFPFLPTIDLFVPFPLFSSRLSFATLGFFFLIQREVTLGLWLFTLLNNLQETIYRSIGWGIEQEPAISVWSYGLPSLVHQGMGAMIVLVLGGLWVGREHIGNVFRKALNGAPDIDDSDEILSYRSAVLGLIGSMGVMVGWLWLLGIPLAGIATLLFFMFIVYMALTRVVAEGGVAVIYAPLVAPDAAVSAIGTSFFGVGLVGLAFTRVFANDLLNFAMPHVANSLKLSGQIEGGRRYLFWGMLLALLAGIGGALWMLMHLAYTYGAIN
ncbi:MAG: hypothetical protein OXE49_14730, partial [Gemmatimonadetes bacterium]|nr:hypothetical protein [Gemmatimonadota bacterium]